jgi:hypothetical protein
MPSRLQDPAEKVGFADGKWLHVGGGRGAAEVGDESIYLAMALRNAGTGMAVLDRWDLQVGRATGGEQTYRDQSMYRRLTRDLYLSAGDVGFWQGALRDPSDPLFAAAMSAIQGREPLTVDLLYGDLEGGQRTISRFAMLPADDGGWLAVVGRHWSLDVAAPR